MKIARFEFDSKVNWGILSDNHFHTIEGDLYGSKTPGKKICSVEEATFLPPILPTNKVPAIAANYGEKDDRDGPGIFMKQPGTYQAHGGSIIYPRSCKSIIYEPELGIVISKPGRHIDEKDALDYVLGYTCVNDVSAVDLVRSDLGKGLSMRWKHFDTFCPVGPYIETEVKEPGNLDIECLVNGELSGSGNTSDMIFPIPMLISWVSEVMTLYPGDIIPSGCPETNEINIGDEVEVRIKEVGSLVNRVVADY